LTLVDTNVLLELFTDDPECRHIRQHPSVPGPGYGLFEGTRWRI